MEFLEHRFSFQFEFQMYINTFRLQKKASLPFGSSSMYSILYFAGFLFAFFWHYSREHNEWEIEVKINTNVMRFYHQHINGYNICIYLDSVMVFWICVLVVCVAVFRVDVWMCMLFRCFLSYFFNFLWKVELNAQLFFVQIILCECKNLNKRKSTAHTKTIVQNIKCTNTHAFG